MMKWFKAFSVCLLLAFSAHAQSLAGGSAKVGGKTTFGGGTSTLPVPTLLRSWGFVGNAADSTGNNFIINLEPSGTPRAILQGHLVFVVVAYQNGLPCTITDDKFNNWVNAGTIVNSGLGTPRKYQVFKTIAGPNGMGIITVGFGGQTTHTQIHVAAFYNVDPSGTLDGFKGTVGIIPANNTAPNVQPGSFTTTANGDLIYNVVFDEGSGTLGSQNAFTGTTPIQFGTGFTGLYGEITYGSGAQFEVQSTAGAINPGMTFSQTTHDSFASIALAIRPGNSGPAPGAGISIVRSMMFYDNSSSFSNTTQHIPFPSGCSGCTGNLLLLSSDLQADTTGTPVTSVNDTNSNTYNRLWATAGSFAVYPIWYATGPATASNSNYLTLQLGNNTGGNVALFVLYDVVGAASSALDTASTAGNSSSVVVTGLIGNHNSNASNPITDVPTIVPSTANGLIICQGAIGTGPASNVTPGFIDYIPATYGGSAGGDNSGFNNGDMHAHVFNSAATSQNMSWTVATPSNGGTASCAAFKHQ